MKTIIAGSRAITDHTILQAALGKIDWKITEVVCGMARGADQLGKTWARNNGIPVREFPAHWEIYGRAAGIKRNKIMAVYAEACIVLWDGFSRGSKNMIEQAKHHNLKLLVYNLRDEKPTGVSATSPS